MDMGTAGYGMSKDLYLWAWVRVEFCTHPLYWYGSRIALPCPLLSLEVC
jgi:hypothetical protein